MEELWKALYQLPVFAFVMTANYKLKPTAYT